MKKLTLRRMSVCGLLAALYAGVTAASGSISYGPIQFRVAEALGVLPYFLPYTTWGLVAGCALANIFSSVSPLDIAVGSLATLLSCLWTSRLKTLRYIALPQVVCNMTLVGAMLSWVLTPGTFWRGFLICSAQVGLGEAAVMLALGIPLARLLDKTRPWEGRGERKQ